MTVRPFDKDKGIYYEFTSCPIADFAKAHGYLGLMPAFCNPDYPMIKAMHGGLSENIPAHMGTAVITGLSGIRAHI